jgi:hypothetical protein
MAVLELKTALVDLSTVQALTGWSERQVRNAVEEGRLTAFHLEPAKSSRTLIRVAAASLMDYLDGRPALGLDVDAWLNLYFRPNIHPRAALVAQHLAFSADHVPRLVRAGDLVTVKASKPGTTPRTGRSPRLRPQIPSPHGGAKAPALIERGSLQRFLKARRI